MIKSFYDKRTEKVFNRKHVSGVATDASRRAHRKLLILHACTNINDLRTPPSNRLEKLHGDREEQHSVRVNRQRRICFEWDGEHAHRVEFTDYH
ncbi:MAG: type II toxin-antitoxin system RelE/ParE family toxin [Bacteroidota bacterium]